MTWIVENLLRNKEVLTEKRDIDSDEYNNLLVIERKISQLVRRSVISKYELELLKYLEQDYLVQDIAKIVKRDRFLVTKDIDRLTEKIGFYLGGMFTDSGFLDQLKENNNLSDDQIKILQNYMKGQFKNKIMRKPNVK